MLPTIRSYLKPYTTMPLAGFMEDVTSCLKDVSPTEMITGLKSAAKKAEPEVQWVGVNGDLITAPSQSALFEIYIIDRLSVMS